MGNEHLSIRTAVTAEGPVPVVGDPPRPLAEIVAACHEKTIDTGLAFLAMPGLDRETLEPILTYCAELRCESRQRHVSRL